MKTLRELIDTANYRDRHIELSTELEYTQLIFPGEDWSHVTKTWKEILQCYLRENGKSKVSDRQNIRDGKHQTMKKDVMSW